MAKSKKPYAGRGYITKRYLVSKKTYNYIKSLTKDLDSKLKDTKKSKKIKNAHHRFLSHLFACTSFKNIRTENTQNFIPIYSRLIEKEFSRNYTKVDLLNNLKNNGLIEIKKHSPRHCREYKLSDEILRKGLNFERIKVRKHWKKLVKGTFEPFSRVNLMKSSGRENKTAQKHVFKTDDGLTHSNIPDLLKDSMKSFKPCPFNPKYVEDYIKDLKKKYIKEKTNFEKAKEEYPITSIRYKNAKAEYLRAHGKYMNDILSQKAILNQNPVHF